MNRKQAGALIALTVKQECLYNISFLERPTSGFYYILWGPRASCFQPTARSSFRFRPPSLKRPQNFRCTTFSIIHTTLIQTTLYEKTQNDDSQIPVIVKSLPAYLSKIDRWLGFAVPVVKYLYQILVDLRFRGSFFQQPTTLWQQKIK